MKEALLHTSSSAGPVLVLFMIVESALESWSRTTRRQKQSDSPFRCALVSADACSVQISTLQSSVWQHAGEYTLAALLAIIFMYTLAFSHTNHSPFSASNQHSNHWWKARHDVPGWAAQHQQYVEEAIAAAESTALQLDFYGDAIVEAWRGTQHGEPNVRCQDAPAIFNAHFGAKYASHAWGMAGDAAKHLMWRLRNGEGLAGDGPQLAVVMVGGTDLTYASFKDDEHIQNVANSTVSRIYAVAQYLSDLRPQSRVLLVGLLPRGDLTLSSDQHLAQPSKFTPAITRINEDLEQFAATRPNMNFVSCGQDFTYESETGRIHQALMPDGVNLNAAGMEQLASCLQPVIHDMAKQLEPAGDAHKHS